MGKKLRIFLACLVLGMFVGGAAVSASAEECGAGCKARSWGQGLKCDLRYSLDAVKCRNDQACKETCRQARAGCRGQAQGR